MSLFDNAGFVRNNWRELFQKCHTVALVVEDEKLAEKCSDLKQLPESEIDKMCDFLETFSECMKIFEAISQRQKIIAGGKPWIIN